MHKPDYFKQIVFVYWTIFSLLLIFAAVAILVAPIVFGVVDWSHSDSEILRSILIILALTGIPAGFIFHSRNIKKIPDGDYEEHVKMKRYRNSFFVKIITLEAMALLSLMGYLLSLNHSFLMIFTLLIVAYLLNIPTKSKISEELSSSSQSSDIND
ncbi:hypothetical protein QA597_02245 [Marinilabiliaceae bacterium ANBcel2]|nr:hypothetical protein [Marinilabiliaceae bacterium ANBcel2]